MFCHQCGTPAEAGSKFCAKCGAVLKSEPTIQATTTPPSPSPTEGAHSILQSQLADRGTRLGAAMLDFFIFIASLIPGIIVISASDTDGGEGFGWALIAIAWLGLFVVQTVMLVKHGQSLGKRALKIRIVRVSDESTPGFVKVVLLRMWVPSFIAGIPYAGAIIWIVDGLFIFRDDRRCLHDLIAGTKVIKA
jgi:uncharacterized RDD family membrane protein YckC